jgi:arylsulfatase A-like enzyme
MAGRPGRALAAAAAAGVALAASLVLASTPAPPPELPPNLIVVLTDDQTVDSLRGEPVAMPWLRAQLADPAAGWRSFSNAVVSTPICCPSRATILTGRNAWSTGVVNNYTGERLDETDTLATRLHAAGYRTAMVGKYLNLYPWDRGPYVPPGWDRWFAKTNETQVTTYYDYPVVDDGVWRTFGSAPEDYVTDVLGREAEEFVRTAPADRPFFLYFSPPSPHAPGTPAPADAARLAEPPPAPPSEEELNDVRGKPEWVRALLPIGEERLAELQAARVRERAALRDVDRWLARIVDALAARGNLDRTVIVFLSDNGYAFGAHRWEGKQVPYEDSIRVPFAIRMPDGAGGVTIDAPVSNADVAPTLASLAGIGAVPADGRDLTPILHGEIPPSGITRRVIPLGWPGSPTVPPWVGAWSPDGVAIRWASGETELYDLRADPGELRNLSGDPDGDRLWKRLAPHLPPPLAAPVGASEGDG